MINPLESNTGLYILEFPPVGGGGKSKGLEMGKEIKGGIVAKALDGQRYPLPLCECMWV